MDHVLFCLQTTKSKIPFNYRIICPTFKLLLEGQEERINAPGITRGMCQKAATAVREIKRRLRRENRGVSSCCLHLAVRILKELWFRLISWWAFHSASFRLPLEIALRWKVLGEKKGTLLCLTLLIWEHIETGNVILAQLFTTKQAEDCQILEGEEWHIEKSDKATQHMGDHGNGLPTYSATVTLCPEHTDF